MPTIENKLARLQNRRAALLTEANGQYGSKRVQLLSDLRKLDAQIRKLIPTTP